MSEEMSEEILTAGLELVWKHERSFSDKSFHAQFSPWYDVSSKIYNYITPRAFTASRDIADINIKLKYDNPGHNDWFISISDTKRQAVLKISSYEKTYIYTLYGTSAHDADHLLTLTNLAI